MDLNKKLLGLINDFTEHVPHEDGQTWEEAFASHLIDNDVTVQQWIPVTERLPECFKRVLVCRKNEDTPIVEQGYKDVGDWWKVYGTRTKKVTHWMPLPEPPKGEEE